MHICFHKECLTKIKSKLYNDKSDLQIFDFNDSMTMNNIAECVGDTHSTRKIAKEKASDEPMFQKGKGGK